MKLSSHGNSFYLTVLFHALSVIVLSRQSWVMGNKGHITDIRLYTLEASGGEVYVRKTCSYCWCWTWSWSRSARPAAGKKSWCEAEQSEDIWNLQRQSRIQEGKLEPWGQVGNCIFLLLPLTLMMWVTSRKGGVLCHRAARASIPGLRDAGGGDPVGPGGAATPTNSKSQQICDNICMRCTGMWCWSTKTFRSSWLLPNIADFTCDQR